MEKLKKDVGIRARAIRERLGFKSREPFAEILNVHSNTVGQLERGTIWLSPEMAVLYRDKFGINPGEFLADEPVMIKPTPEEALEIVRKALEKNSPALSLIPDNVAKSADFINLVNLISKNPDILRDVLVAANARVSRRVDKLKRRSTADSR